MGVSPDCNVNRIRLESTMAEVARGKRCWHIALNARFSSQASFTRAFRRATDLSHAEFRRPAHLTLRCWPGVGCYG